MKVKQRYTRIIVVNALFQRRAKRSACLAGVAALIALSLSWGSSSATALSTTTYPVGVTDHLEPSNMAPPGLRSLAGYRRTYFNDFTGTRLPRGWDLFAGIPGGDPSGRFNFRHVVVAQGLLQLRVYRDPAYANHWVTGGLCQCGRPMTYGAYFVRSRVTSAGVNSVELLWPYNNTWPPEIDFNEDLSHLNLTTGSVHWAHHENFVMLHINMTQWHTWGVIWTPTYVMYVVDGHPWHIFSVVRDVPHIPMVLDFEQRTTCPSFATCPTQPSAMLIDWVAEYRRSK